MKIDLFWNERAQSTEFILCEDVNVNGYVVPIGTISDGRVNSKVRLVMA